MGILIQAMKSSDVQLCSRGEKSQKEKLVNVFAALKGINFISILQTKAIVWSIYRQKHQKELMLYKVHA